MRAAGVAGLALAVGVYLFSCSGGDGKQEPPPGSDSSITKPAEYTRATIVEACVAMHSCGIKRLSRVADCIRHYENVVMYGGLADLYKALHLCVLDAKGDCPKAQACFGAEANEPCDMTYKPGCDGDTMRYCELGDKRIYHIDCSAAGLVCATDPDGNPFCAHGNCTTDGEVKCAGTQKQICVGTGVQVEVCELYTFTCGPDRDKQLDCIGTGKECEG
jgi:hypothetical protein